MVSAAQDVGYNFSLEATLNACMEMSPPVLADSLVFAGDTVMMDGPFTVNSMGNFLVCAGDTLLLIVMSPYTVNIQWFNNSTPLKVKLTIHSLLLIPEIIRFKARRQFVPITLQTPEL